MLEIFGVIIFIVVAFFLWLYLDEEKRDRLRAKKKLGEKAKRKEEARIRECANVVRTYADLLGYIARDVISRDEIEEIIDSGADSVTLSAAIAIRIDNYDAITLGVHPGMGFSVKLKQDFRDRHVYIVGKSGSGKTTLLRQMIMQDMERGNGLAVLAPEQEMITEELLPFVPENRIDDVVYFNPADTEAPVSFNPLHLEEGEDLDRRADENMTIFSRLLGNEGTPRINEILRQAFYALLPLDGTTLLDIPKLLDRENPHYRKRWITLMEDPNTAQFWADTYPQFPKNAHLPLVYRLNRFTQPKYIRNVLCQTRQSINFREIMDSGKIVFFNLSDGTIGEQNSQLLGQLIVSKFQLAVMGRADTPKKKRRRFYLYIDEFQYFTSTASASYEKILSRARKYRLALILAHQQTGQLPVNLQREIFGNVSTMISFVVSRRDAKRLAPEFISTWKGEVETASPDALVAQKVGDAYVKIGLTSFPMKTKRVSQSPDYAIKNKIIEESRRKYGVGRHDPEPRRAESDGAPVTFDLTNPDSAF